MRFSDSDPKQQPPMDDDYAEEYADDNAPSDEYVVADDAAEPQVAAPAASAVDAAAETDAVFALATRPHGPIRDAVFSVRDRTNPNLTLAVAREHAAAPARATVPAPAATAPAAPAPAASLSALVAREVDAVFAAAVGASSRLQLARLRRPDFEAARPAGRVDNVHDAEKMLVVELRDGVPLGAEVVENEDDVASRRRLNCPSLHGHHLG